MYFSKLVPCSVGSLHIRSIVLFLRGAHGNANGGVTDAAVLSTSLPSAYKAIHAALGIVKTFAENEDTLPLNVAMEFRFTKHSDSPLSPAYGHEVILLPR